jgi:hypothetical protein
MAAERGVMAKSEERVMVDIGAERKRELIRMSGQTGVSVASYLRSWIFQGLAAEKNKLKEAE